MSEFKGDKNQLKYTQLSRYSMSLKIDINPNWLRKNLKVLNKLWILINWHVYMSIEKKIERKKFTTS